MMEKMKKIESQHNNTKKPCIQPPLDNPWLLFRAKQGTTGYIYSPTSTLYKGFSSCFPDDFSIRKVYNCCYGWLILSTYPENDLFLWNPVLSKLIKLPLLLEVRGHDKWIRGAVLLSPGNRTDNLDPNCTIMIFVQDTGSYKHGHMASSIFYSLLGQQCWNSVCFDDEIAEFLYPNPIIMNELVYIEGMVYGGKKLFCINRIDTAAIVLTEYCTLPRYTQDELKEGYLVESFGELFYLIVTEDFPDLISFVEAFVFDQGSMKWKEVRDVGDRVFFVDGNVAYSILSCAKKENKGGFLYHCFRQKSWYSYSFAENSLSTFPLQSTWKLPNGFDQTILYLPDRRLIDKPSLLMNLVETGQYEVDACKIKEETDQLQDSDEKIERQTLLFCLSDDLTGFIFRFLNPVDYLNFRSTSKVCRLLAPKIEWGRTPVNLPYASAPISPWLISFNNHSSTYHFVDSEFGCKYLIRSPKSLVSTEIVHSKNGWLLLMSKCRRKTLSFYNPLTSEIIKLPKLHSPLRRRASEISFSSPPTSSNCLVVAIAAYPYEEEIEIFTLQAGKTRWNTRTFPLYNFNIWPNSCPFSLDGVVYVLDNNGNLALFEYQVDEILSVEKVWPTQDPGSFLKQNFLLECDGKLLAASISEAGESVNVFAFNSSTTSWERIDSLGNHSLYLSKLSCFSTTARADWMKNKIFFPRVYDGNIVYYSMETRKYYSLANKDDALEMEYPDTRELLMSGWIEPSWS